MEKGLVKRELISLQLVVVLQSLNERGSEIRPGIDALRKWGEKYLIHGEDTITEFSFEIFTYRITLKAFL